MLNDRRFVVTKFNRVIYPQRGLSKVTGYYANDPSDLHTLPYATFVAKAKPIDHDALAAHFQAHPLPQGNWTLVRYIDTDHVEIQRVVSVAQLRAWSRSKAKSRSKAG